MVDRRTTTDERGDGRDTVSCGRKCFTAEISGNISDFLTSLHCSEEFVFLASHVFTFHNQQEHSLEVRVGMRGESDTRYKGTDVGGRSL